MNLQEKLMMIQQKLKAPKNQKNNFGNYNYRSCEDIMEAVKPLLAETKTILVIQDDIENIGERYYIRAIARMFDTESKEKIEVGAYARESATKKGMDDSQITGAASSYARKYALNGLFCIDDTKDSDGANKHGKDTSGTNRPKTNKTPVKATQKTQADVITPAQLRRLKTIVTANKVSTEYAKAAIGALGYASSKDIKVKDYDVIIKDFELYKELPEGLK